MESFVDKARAFALKHHGAQMYGTEPYGVHLQQVADNVELEAMCLGINGKTKEELLAAAWCHDLIEDTDVTHAQLEEEFGLWVANVVEAVTTVRDEEGGADWPATVENMSHPWMWRARIVKQADRLANVERSIQGGERGEAKSAKTLQKYKAQHASMMAAFPAVEFGPTDILRQRLCDLLD